MGEFYPLARGYMAEVWATCKCPICDHEMSQVDDSYEPDDELGELHLDTYSCVYCTLLVTYVSPRRYGEYRDVPAKERRYFIERAL